MKILLCAPYYSTGSCALFLLKALIELEHQVLIWDYRIMDKPKTWDYDLALVWGTAPIHDRLNKDKKKILLYPDDWTFWKANDPKREISALAPFYDKVYTINVGKEYSSLPMGADPDLHKPINLPKKIKVLFIGTYRSMERYILVQKLKEAFNDDFKYYGNGWGANIGPAYYADFVQTVNSAEVVINEHWNTSPSTKDIEIAACGGLLISDLREGVRLFFPSAPTYTSPEDCIIKAKYYLDHPGEAIELRKQIWQEAQGLLYSAQLSKILTKT